jgi:hypothetical protein
MAVRPRTNGEKRLAYWNADGVRGRKLELEQFLSEHGVDICLWTRRSLSRVGPWRSQTLPPNGPPDSGRRHSDPCPQGHRTLCCASLRSAAPGGYCHRSCVGDQSSEARAGLPLSTRSLIKSDLTECLRGGVPIFLAGDPNAKHTNWNSRLITARSSLLRDYANSNSCLIDGPDSLTMAPYTHNATPTSLIQWLLRTLSYRCIWRFVLYSARPINQPTKKKAN